MINSSSGLLKITIFDAVVLNEEGNGKRRQARPFHVMLY